MQKPQTGFGSSICLLLLCSATLWSERGHLLQYLCLLVQSIFNMLKGCLFYILLLALHHQYGFVQSLKGQCGMLERCCPGRDSSCVVNGFQRGGINVDEPCYCDEGCLETGDCCSDYKSVCNVQRKTFLLYFQVIITTTTGSWKSVAPVT